MKNKQDMLKYKKYEELWRNKIRKCCRMEAANVEYKSIKSWTRGKQPIEKSSIKMGVTEFYKNHKCAQKKQVKNVKNQKQ